MFFMILNDGETYTSLNGCKLAWISDKLPDDDGIDELVKAARTDMEYDTAKIAVIRVFGAEPDTTDFHKG